jgi:hypothetical protein
MQFPIDITFKMLGWRANLHVTDGTGRLIGFVPGSQIQGGKLSIYADEGMGPPIYTIRAEHAFTHWFEDAAGTRIGAFGLTPLGLGKFIMVEGEPRFRFVIGSEWLDFFDRMVPSVPVLSGLVGCFIRPWSNAVRIEGGPDEQGVTIDGADVLKITKQRQLIDIRYRLHDLGEAAARERQCLLLSALVYALQDHSFTTMR